MRRRRRHPLKVVLLLAIAILGAVLATRWLAMQFYPLHHREPLVRYATEYNLDPYFVAAVIKVESRWRPAVVSPKGAVGLMQIMPETGVWAAEQIGIPPVDAAALTHPETNIRIGTWYLRYLLDAFDGNRAMALAAYNGGDHNVRRWLGEKRWTGLELDLDQIPFPETRQFVAKVLRDYRWYQRIYGPEQVWNAAPRRGGSMGAESPESLSG